MYLSCGSLYCSLSHNIHMHFSGPSADCPNPEKYFGSQWNGSLIPPRDIMAVGARHGRAMYLGDRQVPFQPPGFVPYQFYCASIHGGPVPEMCDLLMRNQHFRTNTQLQSVHVAHSICCEHSKVIMRIATRDLTLRGHELSFMPVKETGLQHFHVLLRRSRNGRGVSFALLLLSGRSSISFTSL